jgi:hypothetical protein
MSDSLKPSAPPAKPFNAPPLDRETWQKILALSAKVKESCGYGLIDVEALGKIAQHRELYANLEDIERLAKLVPSADSSASK